MALLAIARCEADPDNMMGAFAPLLTLDMYGIYGGDIYILFSDLCGKDPVKALAVLRAVQLGILNGAVLADACSRQDFSGRQMVNVDELYQKVKERLPNFDAESNAP